MAHEAKDAYLRMLDGVSQRSDQIGSRTIASHWPFVGTDYRRLLIVGQALAGWDDKSSTALWTPADVASPEGRMSVLKSTQSWAAARAEPIAEPLRTRGGKPFWSVSRRVVQALEPEGDGPWYSRYAWWNLFPLGWGDTNQSPWFDALWDAQVPHLKDLFWGVVEALSPTRILILAGKAFWPHTAPALGLDDLPRLAYPLLAGGARSGRTIVWTYHPGARVKGHTREGLATATVLAIRDIERGV